MKDHIERRVLVVAQYIVDTNATVRQAAKNFAVSKSTVHKDLRQRLPYLNKTLYEQVSKVLQFNLSERHIRGGIATKEKYKMLRHKTDKK